jgi:hypothetical protein
VTTSRQMPNHRSRRRFVSFRTMRYPALTSRSPCFERAFATAPSGKSLFT